MSTPHKSFWSGIPGLLTALAGILTGVLGLGGLAFQLGLVGDKDSSSNTTTQTTTATSGSGATASSDGKSSFTVDRSDVTLSVAERDAVVTVTNQGTAELVVKKPDLSGPDAEKFSVDAADCTKKPVAVDRSCELTVTLGDGVEVDARATMTVSADDATDEEVTLKTKLL